MYLLSLSRWIWCHTLKFFDVMGKALSGELSCTGTGLAMLPCKRFNLNINKKVCKKKNLSNLCNRLKTYPAESPIGIMRYFILHKLYH